MKRVHDDLVGAHHDGRVRHLPAELRHHAAVETAPTLVAVHCENGLPEAPVPGVAFTKTRASNL